MPALSEICSSCAACANVCPKSAIEMQLDAFGFFRPAIDASKCVECNACVRACPWLKDVENPNGSARDPRTLAAFALDDSIRKVSSSGGIFSVLANFILEKGGAVVGVAEVSRARFEHVVVERKEDLAKLQGSKYVQAAPGKIYREVKALLKSGRAVLFSGTPCQVAALYSVLGKSDVKNLWTIDVVCHGAPSVKVFEKYLAEREAEFAGRVQATSFRDKRKGWRLFSMTHVIEYSSGDCFQKSSTLRENPFMRVFLNDICLNDSCADCHYGKLPRISDITLGDYWNIAIEHPEMDDDMGTSVVLLNTAQGEALFESVLPGLKTCESSVERAIRGNPCIVRSCKPHPNRAKFFADLDSKPLAELIRRYCPPPILLKRLYRRGRSFLGKWKRRFLTAVKDILGQRAEG